MGQKVRLVNVAAGALAVVAGCDLGTPKVTIDGRAEALDVADLNGDGLADVVGVGGPAELEGTSSLTILLASTDGTLDETVVDSGAQMSRFVDVAALDADADGDEDVAVLEQLDNPDVEFVHLYENVGDGQFAAAGSVAQYVVASGVAAGDITGDGVDDLVLFGDDLSPVQVLVGDGTAGYSQLALPAPVDGGEDVEVTDIDGDGANELLVAKPSSVGPARAVVEIHRFAGDVWQAPVVVPVESGLSANSLAVTDVNDDGHADLVTANGSDQIATPGSVSILLGVGDGTFGAPAVTPGVPRLDGSSEIGSGDIDDDGHVDVVVAHNGGVRVLFGDGAGALEDPHVLDPTGGYASDVAVLDIEGDGIADVVSAGFQLDVFVNGLDGARSHP